MPSKPKWPRGSQQQASRPGCSVAPRWLVRNKPRKPLKPLTTNTRGDWRSCMQTSASKTPEEQNELTGAAGGMRGPARPRACLTGVLLQHGVNVVGNQEFVDGTSS